MATLFDTEDYPTDFIEGNVNDLVYTIISPILSSFRRQMGQDVCLRREKEIIFVDGGAGGGGNLWLWTW